MNETLELALRQGVPFLLALIVTHFLDRRLSVRGLLPPGFKDPIRRILGSLAVFLILWGGIFASLGTIGLEAPQPDLSALPTPQLFLMHAILLAVIGVWFLLGYAGVARISPPPPAAPAAAPEAPPEQPAQEEGENDREPALAAFAVEPTIEQMESELQPLPVPPPAAPVSLGRQFLAQFGFLAPSIPREIGLGLLLGIGSWAAVLAVALVIGLIIVALGGEKALPQQPPALIPFLAGLPIAVRLLISLSAGIVEETFFRGFLQPRIGIVLSTVLFIFAHFSYGQPFMLIGIGTLSLIYAFLVKWRQTIWPAMAAHALFDAVQLVVVIPAMLDVLEGQAPKAKAVTAVLSAMLGN